jgi:hypothetical protein
MIDRSSDGVGFLGLISVSEKTDGECMVMSLTNFILMIGVRIGRDVFMISCSSHFSEKNQKCSTIEKKILYRLVPFVF